MPVQGLLRWANHAHVRMEPIRGCPYKPCCAHGCPYQAPGSLSGLDKMLPPSLIAPALVTSLGWAHTCQNIFWTDYFIRDPFTTAKSLSGAIILCQSLKSVHFEMRRWLFRCLSESLRIYLMTKSGIRMAENSSCSLISFCFDAQWSFDPKPMSVAISGMLAFTQADSEAMYMM